MFIGNLVPRVLSYPPLRSKRERETVIGSAHVAPEQNNSEGGVLCRTNLCLVYAMIARVHKSKIDLLTL